MSTHYHPLSVFQKCHLTDFPWAQLYSVSLSPPKVEFSMSCLTTKWAKFYPQFPLCTLMRQRWEEIPEW